MKTFATLCLLLLSLNAFSNVTPETIVKNADLKRGLGNISHSFLVTISNQDNKEEQYRVAFKDINNSLTEQVAPERAKGRKLLMKDYDMWLFTKNIKKPIRISLEQKLTGEVSNGDIARTNYYEDYDAVIESEDKDAYTLMLSARNKKVTYAKIQYIVSKKDFAPIEATFFALSGKPLKKAQYLDFKDVEGTKRSTTMKITDYLQSNRFSVIKYSEYKKESFSDSLFNKERM